MTFVPGARLGKSVETERPPCEPEPPSWGDSYHRVRVEGECRLRDLLRHFYVLIPVLDDRKHYWVGEAEVEKLLHRGESWLQDHPDREMTVGRYREHQAP